MKEKKMSKKKKILVVAVIVVAVMVLLAVLWKLGKLPFAAVPNQEGEDGYSQVDVTNLGTRNQFMGIVEAGNTEEIRPDMDKEVKEIFVQEGEVVTAGTALFAYDTSDLEKEAERMQQEMAGYDSQIARYRTQIAELEAEKNTVSEENKFEYTTEIQSIQLNIEEAQSSKQSSAAEWQEMNRQIEESTVCCTMDGVVKKINSSYADGYDESQSFITIVSDESYRIKGTVNEQNIANLGEGQTVCIRSRVDETTWTGTITKVDTENPIQSSGEVYYEEETGGSENSSSKYYFYVSLDETKGLMLGQHVYIEPTEDVPAAETDVDEISKEKGAEE